MLLFLGIFTRLPRHLFSALGPKMGCRSGVKLQVLERRLFGVKCHYISRFLIFWGQKSKSEKVIYFHLRCLGFRPKGRKSELATHDRLLVTWLSRQPFWLFWPFWPKRCRGVKVNVVFRHVLDRRPFWTLGQKGAEGR